jgi:DEAD/DEAH box helicase domain-containing protein
MAGGIGDIAEYTDALKRSGSLGPEVTGHITLPPVPARFAQAARAWPRAVSDLLDRLGIAALYSHQAEAVDALRAGRHVVAATPTASGKSLIYTLPVLERHLSDPDAKALFLFPLKALAQDQLASFRAMSAHWPEAARPSAAIYDGDVSAHFRRKIRNDPPTVLFTNPEMLHLSLLPHHHLWATFFAGLSFIVVDEVHSYRGVFGSHMAQVFRRLLRIAALYGASPVFTFCSATVGNPAELAARLTGVSPLPVLENGAPQGKRHYLFLNPVRSPATTAIALLQSALRRNLHSIVYCRSRRMTELVSLWASERSGPWAGRISAYRAGFLPEERRGIEARMASGDLLAVISTSALELGIDIGDLDLCILVGYPGTVMSTLQRGGRVGRSGRESAVILIAGEDALDQYIVRHAEEFFTRPPEKAELNPDNPVILARHLECAAAELPLRPDRHPDKQWLTPAALRAVAELEAQGRLLRSADGSEYLAARKRPQRHLSLRGAGDMVSIENEAGELIGSVDGIRARREAHPGAVYLHLGRHYEIAELHPGAGRALAKFSRPIWYTRARGHKETDILSLEDSRRVAGIAVQRGRLRITDHVSGYEKRAVRGGQLLGVFPLDFLPLIFETEGLWLQIPDSARAMLEQAAMHFMGAIHALEHALIGMLPLLVMSDRNDFGGISTPMHAQIGRPAVFVYDGVPGGAGLTRAAFALAPDLFAQARALIAGCPCELGCPSCVHSPKCGSGNRPIDKEGALRLLECMLTDSPDNRAEAEAVLASPLSGLEQTGTKRAEGFAATAPGAANPIPAKGDRPLWEPDMGNRPARRRGSEVSAGGAREGDDPAGEVREGAPETHAPQQDFVVLDVETRRSAAEVGGWHHSGRMGVSVAVIYDSRNGAFCAYEQEAVGDLARVLAAAPLVVGFNILRFDYAVLAPHAPGVDFRAFRTLDMLAVVHERLSYRLSLDNLARATLGGAKSADGLQALRWWKEGRLREIEEYCRQDVILTRDVYLFGREHGYVLFTNKAGGAVRLPVSW